MSEILTELSVRLVEVPWALFLSSDWWWPFLLVGDLIVDDSVYKLVLHITILMVLKSRRLVLLSLWFGLLLVITLLKRFLFAYQIAL